MDNGHGEAGAAWLAFGPETVPLRDGKTQEVERERSERLSLIDEFHWPRANPRVMLAAALAMAALAVLFMIGSRTGGNSWVPTVQQELKSERRLDQGQRDCQPSISSLSVPNVSN